MTTQTATRKNTFAIPDDSRDSSPALSDSYNVVREMDRARGRSFFGGLFTLSRARFDSWMEERMKRTIVKRLDIRTQLAIEHGQTIRAETDLRGSIVIGMTDDQKRMLEFNTARRQRLLSDLHNAAGNPNLMIDESERSPSAPPVSPHMTKEQIDTFALKAVMNLGVEGEEHAEWVAYRSELYEKLPENLAKEVEKRIKELWSTLN